MSSVFSLNPQSNFIPNTNVEALKLTGAGGSPSLPFSIVSGAFAQIDEISDEFMALTLT